MKRTDTPLALDKFAASNEARDFVQMQIRYDQHTLNDALMLHHGNNAELASALSGTSDKKSKEYKAAIRSIQMYRKGDTSPGRKYQGKLTSLLRENKSYIASRAGDQRRGATVTIRGTVKISKIVEYRTMKTNMSPEKLSKFLSAALKDNQSAYGVFSEGTDYPPIVEAYSDTVVDINR